MLLFDLVIGRDKGGDLVMYLDRLLLSSGPGQLVLAPMSSVMTHEVSQGGAEHHAGQRELREIFLKERNMDLTGVMITVRGSLSVCCLTTYPECYHDE